MASHRRLTLDVLLCQISANAVLISGYPFTSSLLDQPDRRKAVVVGVHPATLKTYVCAVVHDLRVLTSRRESVGFRDGKYVMEG